MNRSKKVNWSTRLAAVVTTGILMSPDLANAAGQNFTDVTKNITTSSSTLPNLITTVSYIGGVGLGVAGILKMKGHVDSPGQVPLKDGLVRLGAGGALLALPMLLEAMTSTVGAGAGATHTKLAAVTY